MAKQITQLPVAASVAASDVFPLDQSGTTKQATLTAIAAGLPTGTGTGGLVREIYPSFFSGFATNGVNGFSATGAWSLNGGATWGPTGGGFVSLFGASHPVNPGLLQLGTNGGGIINVLPSGNVSIGTLSAPSRFTVAGDVRLQNNTNALIFTDQSGTTPYLQAQADGNFIFAGTTAAGAGREIFRCGMRSDTSPLQVTAPIKIGAGGSAVSTVLTAVVTHTPATIAANGGVQFLDVTLTGLTGACNVFVNSFLVSNISIIVRAEFYATDTARIYWINPTASPVTLSSAGYRVSAIVFA